MTFVRSKSSAFSLLLPLLPLLLLLLNALAASTAQACEQVHFGQDANGHPRIACRCSDAYCDTSLEFEWPQNDSSLFKLTSTSQGTRFKPTTLTLDELRQQEDEQQDSSSSSSSDNTIKFAVQVDIGKRFQQVVGYGGAFTDSASMLIKDKLTPASHQHLMSSYFGPLGLNYNLARVPIGGTDMSWRPYSYNDMPAGADDFELSKFSLQDEDLSYKLPLIREANALRPPSESLKLLASSWSAPNWMKSNRNLVQGRLKEDVGSEISYADLNGLLYPSYTQGKHGRYYDAYARYICKFLDQYEQQLSTQEKPFKMWALTPQNEPCTPGRLGHSIVNYNSVNFDPVEMSLFIRAHLIPHLLRNNRTAEELALFTWDDTLLGLDKYKDYLLGNPPTYQPAQVTSALPAAGVSGQVGDYVRGLAIHWYSQGLDKLPYKALYDLRRSMAPRYSLISTEASYIGRPQAGDWTRGEKYARDIIENLRAGSIGWIDWNLALNLQGGPTWSRNFLDSAVLIEEHSGSFLKNPMFYAIGHLSRFIRAKSYIVESQVLRKSQPQEDSEEHLATNGAQKVQVSWRLVNETAEQTSDLLVVASELYFEGSAASSAVAGGGGGGDKAQNPLQRKIALVLLNRATSSMRTSLTLANCRSQLGEASQRKPLILELEPKSITSLAFNC